MARDFCIIKSQKTITLRNRTGLLVRVSEGSKPLPIWNDPFVTSSASIVGIHSDSASSTMSPDQALSEAAFAYAEILDVFATTVEVRCGRPFAHCYV